jgi:hypothetical protein
MLFPTKMFYIFTFKSIYLKSDSSRYSQFYKDKIASVPRLQQRIQEACQYMTAHLLRKN